MATKSAADYATFKIHPAIGIARLGDSDTEIMLTPEAWRELPIKANPDGTPVLDSDHKEEYTSEMRDAEGRVKRSGARFRVLVYRPGQDPAEVEIGQTLDVLLEKSGQVITGTLVDIEFNVYLANKKSVWYEFQELKGEHGYAAKHPRRNAAINDPDLRQGLIIDPGPVSLSWGSDDAPHRASFARGQNPNNPQTYPPPTQPFNIESLGDVLVTRQENLQRLVVLGGHGDAGSVESGIGQPHITEFANNDGWFDDISDGPVGATLTFKVLKVDGEPPIAKDRPFIKVAAEGAWVLVGYPRFAPQISDMVTLDDAIYDVAVRNYAYAPEIYGVPPFTHASNDPKTPEELAVWRQQASYNPDYFPHFCEQIWPILQRPNQLQYVMSFSGGDPHNTDPGGNLDKNALGQPPQAGRDPYGSQRLAVEGLLRKKGGENRYTIDTGSQVKRQIAMPLLCGDNPLTNVVASKFLRLTDTMLFLLHQWAEGKFVNEELEPALCRPPLPLGKSLDRGVLSNGLGGAFCPGAEVCWIIRNPAIYSTGFRINPAANPTPGGLSQDSDYAAGLEPGDLTKSSAVPWQADFHECSAQPIDVTYEQWNKIHPQSVGDPIKPAVVQTVNWWPSHRPMQVQTEKGNQVEWDQGLPDNNTGDLMMVTAWKNLGFILNDSLDDPDQVPYYQQQRNPKLT
ncbi:MAG: hypothetical protein HC897_05395 [Thermoanaerobaculia bacterium]|nr:hypothetical protein [Thermoanaerobaculia bacterium]